MLKRNILGFIGAHPIRTTICGSIESVGEERRRAWLESVEALGRQGGLNPAGPAEMGVTLLSRRHVLPQCHNQRQADRRYQERTH
jgi:hypothetical protein